MICIPQLSLLEVPSPPEPAIPTHCGFGMTKFLNIELTFIKYYFCVVNLPRKPVKMLSSRKSNGGETSPAKASFLEEFKQAVEEVTLAKQGKIKLKTAGQLLSEL
jgi:hypothetical protein